MTTHELANLLLDRDDVEVSDTLTKRLLEKPNGAKTLNPCWCGCGGLTKGKFVPGHDSKFHGLAKKVARGEAEMPEDFIHEEAEADFMRVHDAALKVHIAKLAEDERNKAEKARLKAEKDAEKAAEQEEEADETAAA